MVDPLISAAQLTRRDAGRVYRRVINYPFYMPDLGPAVTQLLVAGKLGLLVQELQRLGALGSRPAAAFLGFLHLKGAAGEPPNAERAEELCSSVARDGDAYAQYLMAWICRATGRDVEALNWLRKSGAKGLFPPAIVDVGRFIVGGIGIESPDTRAALAVLWDAHRLGHRMALVYIAQIFRRGGFGAMGRIFGMLLYPIAITRAILFARRWPLSERAFIILATMKRPLFRVPVVSAESRVSSS